MFPYYSSETSREMLKMKDPSQDATDAVINILTNEQLKLEALAGNITLALVRPSLEGSANIDAEDGVIAETIEEHISDLGILAKIGIRLDEQAVSELYEGDPKEVQLEKKPLRWLNLPNRWAEFTNLMTSGPSTLLLLHAPNVDAVESWRKQIGNWNITDNRDPETIRGKFGVDNFNNLVHGSDSIGSVVREIDIISTCLIRQIRHRERQEGE